MRFADAPPDKILMASDATLRDYFAAHAPMTMDDAAKTLADSGAKKLTVEEVIERLALIRITYADAMLAERAK